MDEYIEREALEKEIDNAQTSLKSNDDKVWSRNKPYFKGLTWARRIVIDAPAADVVEIPKSGIGDLSDGYHTFNELYHHRAVLFSVICNLMPDKAWKSKLHDTGDMYDGMFVVGIETPKGQATYHYDIDPYWEMFKVKELEKAPKWDGHTPQDAIERLSTMAADVVEVVRCKDCIHKVVTEDGEYNPDDIVCDYHMSDGFCENDFCSYGERKDGAE